MTKRKTRRTRKQRQPTSPDVLRRQGAEAFRRGDYDLAIAAWRRIGSAQRDEDLRVAFAEACFRRGVQGHLDSLRQAVSTAGDEPRYTYHLALAHHRAGRIKEAEPLYRRVLDQAGQGDEICRRAAYALGLLLLETDRRPSRDPVWRRLKTAPDGTSLAEARQRLTWAEGLLFTRSAPTGPAPDPLWEILAAQHAGRDEAPPLDPDSLPGTAAAVAHHRLAARAWEQGQAEDAFNHWRAACDAGLDLTEDNLFAAARTVATQRLQADDAAGALEAASAGLAIQPDDNGLATIAGQAHFRLGCAAAMADRWDEAYEHWQAVLEVGDQRGRRLVINLALAEEQRENWFQAAELWREALRRRPRKADHPDALDDTQVARLWRHVAESYRRVGQTGEALNTYRNALKWAPDDVELRTAYVDMLLDDGRLTAADNQLDVLLKTHPNDVELLERRAQVYAAQDYSYAAVNVWKRVLELQPDHPSARREIARQFEIFGDNLYHWGMLQGALERYQEGLEYAPDDAMLLASIGMSYLELGQEKLARQFFDRACTAEPDNQNVYLLAIKVWLDHGDLKTALAVLQRARKALELSTGFFLDLAEHCYSSRMSDLAHEFITGARALAADDVNLLLMIADVVGRNGDYALAQELIQEALEIDPENPVAYLLQGLVQVSLGNLKAARRSWDQAERIARQINAEPLLLAVEQMRYFYDPDHEPSLGLLRRMLRDPLLGDAEWDDDEEEWVDDDEEWFDG
jgi:tetratricopeptide (TPR) repeat protein